MTCSDAPRTCSVCGDTLPPDADSARCPDCRNFRYGAKCRHGVDLAQWCQPCAGVKYGEPNSPWRA